MATEDILAKVELFADLEKTDVSRLAKTVVTRDFKKGEVIVRENEIGVAFYVIASGSVEVVKGLATADEQGVRQAECRDLLWRDGAVRQPRAFGERAGGDGLPVPGDYEMGLQRGDDAE